MSTIPSKHNFAGNTHGNAQPVSLPKTETRYPTGVPDRLQYPNMPAWGLLERAAREVPNRVAAEFLGRTFSYAEINVASQRLANWLQQQGIQAGKRVGILLPNCPEYLIALNAIWRAGGVAVSISPLSSTAEVERLLSLTETEIVISLDALTGLLANAPDVRQTLLVSLTAYLPAWKSALYLAARWRRTGHVRFPTTETQHWFWGAINASNTELIPVEILPTRDPAYILSTGGTTDDPKAVTLSHRNIVANAWQQMHWAGATMGEETMLAILPFFHSYGMSTMLTTGCALGATLVMQPRFHPGKALYAIKRRRPTVFHTVPAMLVALNHRLRSHPVDLSSLKWVISGGASLPIDVAEEFSQHSGALVVEGFGLSEASPVTHVGPLDGSNVLGTIGLPLPDTYCRIVDADTGSHDLPDGEVGELVIYGPQVMLGYWRNPEATDRAIRNGWLFTGDLAKRTANGFYQIVDRKKDLIITSGFNVYPADVEQVLRECEDIQDVAVVGVPDHSKGEIVKAFVVLKPGKVWNPTKLEKFCRQHLAAHRRPQQWEQVEKDLPRNFLGKVLRRQLRQASSMEFECNRKDLS